MQELELPDIWDTSHEEDALYAMSWIIHHRNDDCTGIRADDKEQLARPYMDLYTAANQHRQEVPSRQVFEKVITMIPPREIERAVQLFEKTWWELVRRYYINRNVYSQLQQKIDAKFSSYARKTEMLAEDLKGATTRLKQQTDTPPLVLTARHPWEQNILPNMHRAAQERSELLLRAKQLEEQEAVLEEEQEQLDFAMQAYLDTLGDILTIPKAQRDEMYFPEAAAVWEDYTIQDPYALCFAFLYLLDQGSDLSWVYAISLPVMEQCASVLPWRYEEFELEDWYGTLYEYVRENDPEYRECRNLAQIVYELTGSVMPRNLTRYESALTELDYYGINGKKALHPLLYCMTMLGELRHRAHVYQLIRQADTIWIQTNALSHAFFYKIITEARKYEIPARYFSFASAEKCAEQLALGDMG